jgi:very-short-patch-repair endonuclease
MDKEKDSFLTTCGWDVVRIRWHNPASESGKSKLYPQIKNLLNKLK